MRVRGGGVQEEGRREEGMGGGREVGRRDRDEGEVGKLGGEGEGWRRREVGRTREVHTTQRRSGEGAVERRGDAVNRWEGAVHLHLCVCGPKGLCVGQVTVHV